MSEKQRPLQRLLALDKFGISCNDRVYELARVIKVDLDDDEPERVYRPELHEWALKWIIDKVRTNADGARLQVASWRLLRKIILTLRNPSLPRIVKQGGLFVAISDTFNDIGSPAIEPRQEADHALEAQRPVNGHVKKRKHHEIEDSGEAAEISRMSQIALVWRELVLIMAHLILHLAALSRLIVSLPSEELHILIARWLKALTAMIQSGREHSSSPELVNQHISLIRTLWKRPFPLWSEHEEHRKAIGMFGGDLLHLKSTVCLPGFKGSHEQSGIPADHLSTKSIEIDELIDDDVLGPIFSSFTAAAIKTGDSPQSSAMHDLTESLQPLRRGMMETLRTTAASQAKATLALESHVIGLRSTLRSVMTACVARCRSTQMRAKRIEARFVETVLTTFLLEQDQAANVSVSDRQALLAALLDPFRGRQDILSQDFLRHALASYEVVDMFDEAVPTGIEATVSNDQVTILARILDIQPSLFNVTASEGSNHPSAFLRLVTFGVHESLEDRSSGSSAAFCKDLILPYIETQIRTRNASIFLSALALVLDEPGAFSNCMSIWNLPSVQAALSSLVERTLDAAAIRLLINEADKRLMESFAELESAQDGETARKSLTSIAKQIDRRTRGSSLLVDTVATDSAIDELEDVWTELLAKTTDRLCVLGDLEINRGSCYELLILLHNRLPCKEADFASQSRKHWRETMNLVPGEARVLMDASATVEMFLAADSKVTPTEDEAEAAIRYMLHALQVMQEHETASTGVMLRFATLLHGTADQPQPDKRHKQQGGRIGLLQQRPMLMARVLQDFPDIFECLPQDVKQDFVLALLAVSKTAAQFELLSRYSRLVSAVHAGQYTTNLTRKLSADHETMSADQIAWVLANTRTMKDTRERESATLLPLFTSLITQVQKRAEYRKPSILEPLLIRISDLAERCDPTSSDKGVLVKNIENIAALVDEEDASESSSLEVLTATTMQKLGLPSTPTASDAGKVGVAVVQREAPSAMRQHQLDVESTESYEQMTLVTQLDEMHRLLQAYETSFQLQPLASLRLLLHTLPRKEQIEDRARDPAKRILIDLAIKLQSAKSPACCYALIQCIQIILKDKRNLVSQPAVEEVLIGLSSLLSSTHPITSGKKALNLHLFISRTVQMILQHHRSSLRGRHHLLTPLLTRLLAAFFEPYQTRQSRTQFDRPSWLEAAKPPSAVHATRYARCITLLCNPPPSTVRRQQKSSRPQLLDPVREARIEEAAHVGRLLSAYCHFQLHGTLAQDVKETLTPAMYAIFDVLHLADPEDPEKRVRVVGSSMGRDGLALLRRVFNEWKRLGLWKG